MVVGRGRGSGNLPSFSVPFSYTRLLSSFHFLGCSPMTMTLMSQATTSTKEGDEEEDEKELFRAE